MITKIVTFPFKHYVIDFMSYAHVVPILFMNSYSINKSKSYGYIMVPCNVLFSLPKPLTTLKHGHKLLSLLLPPNASLLSITSSPQLYKTIKICLTYQIQNNKKHYYYHIDNSLQLLKSGDIETNPRPMPNILKTHPSPHRRRYKTYFIECTIKLQPEYQHLAKTFSSVQKTYHPNHINATKNFPYLTRYLNLNRHHLEARILFALITTISLDINSCEHQLIQIQNLDWTSILLEKMTILQNPHERHINTPHPYTKFTYNYDKTKNPTNTMHNEIYDIIYQTPEPIDIHTLTEKFPFLPNSLLNQMLRIYEPLNEYSHPPARPQIPQPPIPNVNQNYTNNIQLIS